MQDDHETEPQALPVPDVLDQLLKADKRIKALEAQVASYRFEYEHLRVSARDQIRAAKNELESGMEILAELVDYILEERVEHVIERAIKFLALNEKQTGVIKNDD